MQALTPGVTYEVSFSFRSVNNTILYPERTYGKRVLAVSIDASTYEAETNRGILGFAQITNLSASENFADYTFTAAEENFLVFDFSAEQDSTAFVQEFKNITVTEIAGG